MLEQGKTYKTSGGWDATVIWVSKASHYAYVIHKPNTTVESVPIPHNKETGKAENLFSIGSAPTYGVVQPADLICMNILEKIPYGQCGCSYILQYLRCITEREELKLFLDFILKDITQEKQENVMP